MKVLKKAIAGLFTVYTATLVAEDIIHISFNNEENFYYSWFQAESYRQAIFVAKEVFD